MNKITKLFAAGLFIAPFAVNAQVSTTVEKKTAILEEYTGNYCTYCPEGHLIADDIYNTLNAITVKIQTGGFSGTDPIFGGTLQTPTGNAIAAPWDSQGYPNGTVNRHSSYDGIGRGQWKAAVQTINAQDAPVNLLVESSIDVAARTLDVSVEYYYTATEANATNYLHIGYYQDNIAAFQYDPGLNPGGFYLLDEEIYEFDHKYRDNVNGTWGEAINATAITSTGTIAHQITLPASFSTFDVAPGAIKVYAFITNSAQGEVLNAAKSSMVYTNFPSTDEIELLYVTSPTSRNCIGEAGSYSPKVLVGTSGSSDLTTFTTDYGVNGGADNYVWNGNLKHDEKTAITLAATNFTFQASNTANVDISNPNGNGDILTDNSGSTTFGGGPSGDEDVTIDIVHDNWGDEFTWNIKNSSGTTVASGGPYNYTGQGNTWEYVTIPTIQAGLSVDDCYTFNAVDSYGDGFGPGGSITIKDGNNVTLVSIVGDYGAATTEAFQETFAPLALNENTVSELSIYPNPTNGNTNVEFNVPSSSNVTVEVINTLGQVVINNNLGTVSGAQKINIDGANLVNGIYFVNLKVGNTTTTQKLTVSK